MLLLGSAGRNSGKTLFACRLIEHLSGSYDVVGLKIATIRGDAGHCVRGRTDCGVCSSLTTPYELLEEPAATCMDTGADRGPAADAAGNPVGAVVKDTQRMARSGAKRIFWLKTRPEALADGIEEFRRRLSPGEVVVCESNSLRDVVVPDLFFMLTGGESTVMKPSARGVSLYADRIVKFDGEGFDLDPSEVLLLHGQFAVRMPGSALLLAGGGSTRMGTDKRYLKIDGTTLVRRSYETLRAIFDEVYVAANDTLEGIPPGAMVQDRYPGTGPIGGIAAGLEASSSDRLFVIACDIPDIDFGLLSTLFRRFEGHDVSVPVREDGRCESLFALYRKSILSVVDELVAAREYRIRFAFARVEAAKIQLPIGTDLRNLNTRAEYERVIGRSRDSE